jgi:hypothetical protein
VRVQASIAKLARSSLGFRRQAKDARAQDASAAGVSVDGETQRRWFLVTGTGGVADEPYRLRLGLEQSQSERMGRKSRKVNLPTYHAKMTLPGPSTRDASPGPESAATRTGSAFIRAPFRGWQRAGEGTSDTNRTRPWLSRERNGSRTQDVRTPARLRGLASAAPNLFRG